jgi:hypothetical protein
MFMKAQSGGVGAIVENIMVELETSPEVEVDLNPIVVDVSDDIVVTLDQPVDVEVDVG